MSPPHGFGDIPETSVYKVGIHPNPAGATFSIGRRRKERSAPFDDYCWLCWARRSSTAFGRVNAPVSIR